MESERQGCPLSVPRWILHVLPVSSSLGCPLAVPCSTCSALPPECPGVTWWEEEAGRWSLMPALHNPTAWLQSLAFCP